MKSKDLLYIGIGAGLVYLLMQQNQQPRQVDMINSTTARTQPPGVDQLPAPRGQAPSVFNVPSNYPAIAGRCACTRRVPRRMSII